MKQLYSFIIFLFTSFVFSQNFTDTKGELQISSSGTATYDLPVVIPPSLKGFAPAIRLTYNSGQRGGIAGQGWNINSISTISRIGTRKDIDGFVDGVDFDSNDKLALDGQRLLIKTGSYWASGSTYETEYKSNKKIELFIEGTTTYFIVTAPDGSRNWYGSVGGGNLQNYVTLNAWYVIRSEDANGNFINYFYDSYGKLHISSILFSGNSTAGISTQNKIEFKYRDAKRYEREYVKGTRVNSQHILESIVVYSNNTLYRTYKLTHATDAQLGYERVASIKEINAQSEESNPVTFTYATSPVDQERKEKVYANNLNFDKYDISGDFDGDGRLDFTINNQLYTNLFNGSSGSAPITMPVYTSSDRSFTATTLTNNKLNQFNTIINVEPDLYSLTFRYYNLTGGTVNQSYIKTVPISNVVINEIQCSTGGGGGEEQSRASTTTSSYEYPEAVNLNNQYLEGDFNGDGISEVIIFQYQQTDHYGMDGPCTGPHGEALNCNCILKSTSMVNCANGAYYLNLAPNGSTTLNTSDFVFMPDFIFCKEYEDKYTADFNGDGKTDILIVNKTTKNYRIISLQQLTSAPWVSLDIIGVGNLDKYSPSKQILFGDYNGDGKNDIMLPDSEGGPGQDLWYIYFSNGNPSGGEYFTQGYCNIVEYRPNTSTEVPNPYTTQIHYSTYYAMDINKDGKTDLVRVWRKYYSPSSFFDPQNHNTQWQVTGFINNIDYVGAIKYPLAYDSGVFDSNSPDKPIAVGSNYRFKGTNTDIVLVRGHYNRIEYYQFNKNVDTENRLIQVSEASGNIIHNIEYKSIEAGDGGLGNASSDFYSSENVATYPFIDVIRDYKSYFVSKVTETVNGVSKYQDFRYRSYIYNYEYGAVGFARTTRSNWYLSSSDTKIWNTQFNDPNLRGTNTTSWTSTNATTVFNTVPTDLLTTSTSTFQTYTNPSSKLFNILLDKQINTDHSRDTKTETTFTYDGTVQSTNYFGLQSKIESKSFVNGSTLQGTKTIEKEYYNSLGSGTNYYVGRPKKNTFSNTIYTGGGDTRTSNEIYTYTGVNLTRIENNGNNTFAVFQDFTYDSVGNVLTTTTSAPSAPNPASSRTVTNEYDSSNRFVAKRTDHPNFISNFNYNSQGQVTQSTDPLGITNVYAYDNWGKLLTTTTQNVSATPIVNTNTYAKLSNGGYTVTSTDNLDRKTIIQYDVLNRPVITSSKSLAAGSTVSVQTIYDGLGRKKKESEPYFSSPSSLWTEYDYDYQMRVTQIKSPANKFQTFSYPPGQTITSNDDGKTTTLTMDALGNQIQTTDPGGTIDFTYYADGQLKQSNYQGETVGISIDGWGNKSGISNPTTGSYAYSYDPFKQVKTQTNSQGTTTYVYNNYGKPTGKTVTGTNNSNTTYAYNAFGQIINSTYTESGKTTTTTYDYDSFKRLYKTTESTPYALFVKEITFDSLGRIETQTSSASVSGKTSSNVIKNFYQNGFLYQIKDNNTQQVLWQLNSVNERDQLTGLALGNGIAIANTYDQYGYASQFKFDKTGSNPANVLTLTTAFEPKRGNLNNRTNNMFNWNETFGHDASDQLLTYNNAVGQQESQSYDAKGKITQNNLGTYDYTVIGKTYQNNSITLSPQALAYYQNRGIGANSAPKLDLEISYNSFKSPFWIKERGRDGNLIDYVNFIYNDDNNRSTMFYGGSQDDMELRPFRKHYSADGTIEVKENKTTGNVEFFTYIGGDGYNASIVLKKDNSSENYLYLHRDYQGSIIAVTNPAGTLIEKRLFDAWGSILKVQDSNGNILPGLTVLDRGYTGHEHLQSVGLINMNARLYDPMLHRFLQVDDYIQDPANTQNYNQYGYVLNNPLKYTDPSGNTIPEPGKNSNTDGQYSGWTNFAVSVINTVKQNWDNWGIKDWANKNINYNNFEDGLNFFGQNFKSFGDNITSPFRKNIGNSPAPRDVKNSETNNNLAITGGFISGVSGYMNELEVVKYYNAAPAGTYATNYNGTLRYWSEAFKGGTRAEISYASVQTAKASANALKLSSTFGKYASIGGSYVLGYYSTAENIYKRDYYHAATDGTANTISILASGKWGSDVGIAWTFGYNILGPWVTNTELYNRIFFGKNSKVYKDLEIKNGWYESKIFKD